MSSLHVHLHPKARNDIELLARSSNPVEKKAVAQLLQLIALVRSVPSLRDRLLAHFESVTVKKADGTYQQVDIRIISQLKDIATDSKFHTDAVRRIRDLGNSPADDFRVFFAPREPQSNGFHCEILGIFNRKIAYSRETLHELKVRYENPK
jgi:hypothetical protein